MPSLLTKLPDMGSQQLGSKRIARMRGGRGQVTGDPDQSFFQTFDSGCNRVGVFDSRYPDIGPGSSFVFIYGLQLHANQHGEPRWKSQENRWVSNL